MTRQVWGKRAEEATGFQIDLKHVPREDVTLQGWPKPVSSC